ncbi:MAG: threonine synthase [Elusimicrobiales bacterium]|nr:threonine synthase [Elusimicrobiales bacterium]NLH38701.1 threonine synthase [Elusimicrobiota bacterium]
MKKIKTLKCISCGKEHSLDEVKYVCSACGGNLEVIYDYNLIKKRFTQDELKENSYLDMWRYADILPVDDLKDVSPLRIGYTPLYRNKRLADEIGVGEIYIKDDTTNPSSSFKDRASAVVVKRLLETYDDDKRIIATASTGNAASSLSCISASLGIKNIIFVPETAPIPKITQLLVFGANVIMVKGSYDDAFDLCVKACDEFGWYNRNTGYNPFTREGKKTAAFEICEQLEWEVPDKVFVPVGDGNIISGIWKGFLEFKKIGFIDKLPKLVAVQSENSNAVYNAFIKNTTTIEPVSGETICDSISVKIPRDGLAALIALKESGGFAVNVSDKEVLVAVKEFASKTGVFAEPSAAAVYAGLKKAVNEDKVDRGDSVLLLITGSGLKDIDSARKAISKAYRIEPDMNELKKIISSILNRGH